MHPKDRRHVLGRREALTRLHIAVGDVTANLGGDLIVERERVVPMQLDFLHGDRQSITIMDGPTALKERPAPPGPPEAVIREARRRQRRRWILACASAMVVLSLVVLIVAFAHGQSGPERPRTLPARPHPKVAPPPSGSSVIPGAMRDPQALAVAPNGGVLIDSHLSDRIFEREPDGVFRVIAGNGRLGLAGDGGPASQAELNLPVAIAVGADGTIYIANLDNNRIRAVSPAGTISTLA